MFPVFDDTQSGRTPQSIALKVLLIALAAIFAGGAALMFFPDAGDTPVMRFLYAIAVLAIGGSVLTLVVTRMSKPKTKRGLEGLDLYSVIDSLVDDVDDDEAAYLQKRLDEREAKHKDDLTVSIDDVLEQRAQTRGSSGE
jgi:hypothetical protein